MSILEHFESKVRNKKANIGIGLGGSDIQNQKILNVSGDFIIKYNLKISFIGNEASFSSILNQDLYQKLSSNINIVSSNFPEKDVFEFLNNNPNLAFIRGSFSSNKFLKHIKTNFGVGEINRLALLETVNGHQFFFGPVGIDECNNLKKKISFIKLAINEMERLNMTPRISILSGGRESDLGRDIRIDETVRDANKIVEVISKKYPKLNISHDEILIENAVNKKSNLIIAPDGISGNLIYRTLVHLGGGRAFGAIYMGLKNIIIDTSRVAELSEIEGALLMALVLAD